MIPVSYGFMIKNLFHKQTQLPSCLLKTFENINLNKDAWLDRQPGERFRNTQRS